MMRNKRQQFVVGDEVIAKHKNNMYYRGVIVERQVLYLIKTEHGGHSQASKMWPQDIVVRNLLF